MRSRGKHVKYFIAFVILGIAAVGSGMMLASRFSVPESHAVEAYAPPPEVRSGSYVPDMPSVSDVSMPSLPDMPRSLPDTREAVDGAGRAFGKATDSMEYYSDRAFGDTARKVKRSVDDTRMPTLR